ncbi:NEW3 domain-containing protein [Lysobacter korlensis]|uniref:NEW3 domain-containing protein n=1 Tax=Lysobacter korlensis TaxID=553636 RepID=A0ABV6RRN4_9GAMM
MTSALLAVVTACTSMPAAPQTDGTQATIEGTVAAVDTSPWAYDGNAVVTVSTDARGTVSVQLPARWNLCKATAPDELQRLKPGDRVQATGTLGPDNALVVCERAEHRLQRLE